MAAVVLMCAAAAGCVAPPDDGGGEESVSTFVEAPEDRFAPSSTGWDQGGYERQREVFDRSFPRFAWAAGAQKVSQMQERSCGSHLGDTSTTSFQANVQLVSQDADVGEVVAENVRAVAELEGWVVEDPTAKQGMQDVLFTARHPEVGLVVEVRDAGSYPEQRHGAAVFMMSACGDRPDGHLMYRSVYDQSYGSSDGNYTDSGNGSYGPQRPLDRPEGDLPEPPAGVWNAQ